MNLRTLRSSGCAVLCAAAALTSQQIPEGLASSVGALPGAANSVQILPGDRVVWFDGTDLLMTTPGAPSQTLLQLPAPVFGSFTIAAGPNHVLFGESSTHDLWLVPLSGPAPTSPLTNIAFSYDATMLDAQHALISARTGGFSSPDNDVILVDLATGATQKIASVPGASGPVALDDDGDVYYATGSNFFPLPPGQAAILRFPRALVDQAIQQQSVLGLADADVVISGLDVASDLCFDDDGDLLFADWWNNQIGELNDASGPSPWLGAPLLSYGILPGAAGLQFIAGSGPGVFEPFQPDGGRVFVYETDFFSTSSLRTLQATRPDVVTAAPSPVPTGNFTLSVDGGPAGGLALLAIAIDATPGSQPISIGGFEQPLHLGLALLAGPIVWAAAFDAQGSMSQTITNPGFTPPTVVTAQVVMFSMTGVLGATPPHQLLLGS